jgi:gliding motility-associated-like protein
MFPLQPPSQPTKISICPGEAITAELSPKGKKVLWSPAPGLSDPTSYSPAIKAMQGTTYTVTLSDSTGCPNSSEAVLDVHVKKAPLVDAGPDRFYSTGTSFTLAPIYGPNISSYLWFPSDSLSCTTCPSPTGTASKTRQYIIRVTSDSGCVASDTVMIGVDCRSAVIFMPKAFTPNNDNLNDWFYPKTVGIKTINRFTIYNRYGQPVFEARNFPPNDKSFGWDGKYRGVDQPMNTYIFTIESVCDIGEKVVKNGSFVLMR